MSYVIIGEIISYDFLFVRMTMALEAHNSSFTDGSRFDSLTKKEN
jgi:hypothetical protein